MRSFLILAFGLSQLMVSSAQDNVSGRLLVSAPSSPLTCETAVVQWLWTGSSADVQSHTVSMAVEPMGDSNSRRRSLAEPSPIRFVRKRASNHARDTAINIAGGSSLPMTDGSWTWNSVGVPTGMYRMALTIDGVGITAYSDTFEVSAGPDTSCLGSLGTASSTQLPSSISTVAPATKTSSATADQVSSSSSSSPIPSAQTNPSSFTTPEDSGSNSSTSASKSNDAHSNKGLSSGSIAAAVLLPLIAVGVFVWLFFLRRKRQGGQASTAPDWSEKFTGFFGGAGGKTQGHRRQISAPMDPVHAAGLAMHDHSVMTQMRSVGNDGGISGEGVTRAPEHWVDFHPDVQETDAHLVSPSRVDEMVRASMDDRPHFYQQGVNTSIRKSTIADQRLTMETESDGNSTLPSYLRDADFTSQHTHSSFGHEANGTPVQSSSPELADVPLTRSSSEKSSGAPLARSESKVRRKPVPTYRASTVGDNQEASSSSTSLGSRSEVDGQGPFSDSHQVEAASDSNGHTSNATTVIQDEKLQEMLATGDQEYLMESPILPSQLLTPVNSSRSFPVSVHSSVGDSPAQRTLLGTPRIASLTEEQKKDLYKLSVQLPQDDRGFRVSF